MCAIDLAHAPGTDGGQDFQGLSRVPEGSNCLGLYGKRRGEPHYSLKTPMCLGTRVPSEVGICAELPSKRLEPTETDADLVPTRANVLAHQNVVRSRWTVSQNTVPKLSL
jgi:hypothetical protein